MTSLRSKIITWLVRNTSETITTCHLFAVTFRALKQDKYNFLCNLPTEQYEPFRALVIELVLVTDLKASSRLARACT